MVDHSGASHSRNGDAVLVGETDGPVVGGLMIPLESADLGEDGASGIGVPLAAVEMLAESQELRRVLLLVGVEHAWLVGDVTSGGPLEPVALVLTLGSRGP